MDEYISREAAIKAAFRLCNKTDYPFIDDIQNALEELPAADVRLVVRGKWIAEADFLMDVVNRCSVCGEGIVLIDGTPADNQYNFCPACGADMRCDQTVAATEKEEEWKESF